MLMKRMLLGIFLMPCSNWRPLFGVASLMNAFLAAPPLLTLAAGGCFISGLAAKAPKERNEEN